MHYPVTRGPARIKLSDFQKKRIDESREQVKSGHTVPNEDLQKEIKLNGWAVEVKGERRT